MNIIRITHPYDPAEIYSKPIVLCLGFFDGLHLGHQEVIQEGKAISQQKGIPLALMTFDQHPKILYQQLNPDDVQYLTPLDRKMELMQEQGIDILYIVEYSKAFGLQDPQTFVDDYIVGLHTDTVVAGFDYTYGPQPVANMKTLPEHGRGRFDIVEVSEKSIDRHKIGSTNIKELVQSGQIDLANRELGHIYETRGQVVHGDKRGRLLGYPTANIQTFPQHILPGIGIYVVEIQVKGRWYQGMASIGYNKTFEGNRELRCEVNIFDFDEDIYDETVAVRWYKYLRGEIKFSGADGLIEQLHQDKIDTQTYFANNI